MGILNAGTKFGDDGGMLFDSQSVLASRLTTGVDTGPVRATSTASVVLSAAVSDLPSPIHGHGLTPSP